MEAIRSIPLLEAELSSGNQESAKAIADILEKHGKVMARYLQHVAEEMADLADTTTNVVCRTALWETLVRIYFFAGNDSEAIKYMLKCPHILKEDGVYTQGLFNIIVDNYIREPCCNEKLKEDAKMFINTLILGSASLTEEILEIVISAKKMDILISLLQVVFENSEAHDTDSLVLLTKFVRRLGKNYGCFKDILGIYANIYFQNIERKYDYEFMKSIIEYLCCIQNMESMCLVFEKECQKDTVLAFRLAEYIRYNYEIIGKMFYLGTVGQMTEKFPSEIRFVASSQLENKTCCEHFLDKTEANSGLLGDIMKYQNIKNSMNHMAISFANGFLYFGTSRDFFIRENMEFIHQVRGWTKFVTISSIGMIHFYNPNGMDILKNYVPENIRKTKISSESGGSLFALGLMRGNDPFTLNGMIENLLEKDRKNASKYIIYGACLGLGAANIALGNETQRRVKQILGILTNNCKDTSDAAALSLGLQFAGTGDVGVANTLLSQAQMTSYDRLQRFASVAIAAIAYGHPEMEFIVDKMLSEPLMRYGAMFCYGMMYVGTSNERIANKLLTYANNDETEDVRRAATLALAFLHLKDKERMKRIFLLLSQNHCANVRYGAALALGIGFSTSVDEEVAYTEERLLYDRSGLVRQGACIATGMLLMQANRKQIPRYQNMRKRINDLYTGRTPENSSFRIGAIIGQSLMECANRSFRVRVVMPTDTVKMTSAISMLLFLQYWYWYPLVPFLSNCLEATIFKCYDTLLNPVESFGIEVDMPESFFQIEKSVKTSKKKEAKKYKALSLSQFGRLKSKKLFMQTNKKEEEQNKEKSVQKNGTIEETVELPEENSHYVYTGMRYTSEQQQHSENPEEITFFVKDSESCKE